MNTPEKRSPAPRGDAKDRASYSNQPHLSITTRIEVEALATRLHACGPRVIYELLADSLRGRELGETLTDFARIDPALYALVVAIFVEGGRA